MLKTIGLILLGIILLLFIVLVYAGAFLPVTITEGPSESYILVYEMHTGPYQKSAAVMDKVFNWLTENDIKTTQGMGFYFDNPRSKDSQKLRYIAGCIIDARDAEAVAEGPFLVGEFPVVHSIIATFPYKRKLHIIAGLFKVYPRFTKFVETHNYDMNAIMEIYNKPAQTISYIMPLRSELDPLRRYYDQTE